LTTSEWISVLALAISSGAFAIQFRNWLVSGPRLRLNVMADAISFPRTDNKPKLALTVINRGDAPTVLTHMVGFTYKSSWLGWLRPTYKTRWLQWLGRKAIDKAWIVNSPMIPHELKVNQTWTDVMIYDQDTVEGRAKGCLYVGVISAHSSRYYLIRVPPKEPLKLPTETKTGVAPAAERRR
jgi:hypothetical protein